MPTFAIFLLITLPWLNPFSTGPSPGVVPLLFAWACAAVLLGGCGRLAGRAGGERLLTATVSAWLVAALLSALMGVLQYVGATEVFGVWVDRTAVGDAFANLRQRNQFATLTNMGLAALLWWVGQGSGRLKGLFEVAVVVAAMLLGVGNAASSSRTGLLQAGLLAGLFVVVWGGWRRPPVLRVLLAYAMAYGVALLLLPRLVGLAPSTTGAWVRLQVGDGLCDSRLTLWRNVLQLIAQKPWLGWGWGELDYAHFITLYPGPRFCNILDNAHNLPLHLAVELGVPVALLVCGGGLWWAWRARPWRETQVTRQMAWSVLAVILLHSLLEYPLWYGPFQMAFGLCLWLLWRVPVTTHNQAPMRFAPAFFTGVAALWMAFIAYAAWDYHRISQIYLAPESRSAAYRDNTLEKLQRSWLFRDQVHFAELNTTPLTLDNASHLNELATHLLHFSPEPSVVGKLIESATLLGRDEEALFYQRRYQAAFPESLMPGAQVPVRAKP